MVCLLLDELEYKPWVAPEVANHALERCLVKISGARHTPADFLRGVNHIRAIGAQIIRLRSLASEASEVVSPCPMEITLLAQYLYIALTQRSHRCQS